MKKKQKGFDLVFPTTALPSMTVGHRAGKDDSRRRRKGGIERESREIERKREKEMAQMNENLSGSLFIS